MSRQFKIEPRYYDDDRKLYKHSTIEFNPGITILIGCNGSGKTTLLQQIKAQLDKTDTPNISYDNLHDGGSNGMSKVFYNNDYALGATMMCSSEGERIVSNLKSRGIKVLRNSNGKHKLKY